MSSFYIKNGTEYPVKNLGWLLRHWSQVKEIGFNYGPTGMKDGTLWAKGIEGGKTWTYFSDFASLAVLWRWLNRPVFKGQPFSLGWDFNVENGPKVRKFTIGNDQWKEWQRWADSDCVAFVQALLGK